MALSYQYWALMDGRAKDDVDSAMVLEVCDTEDEALASINDYGADTCVVYVCDDEWTLTHYLAGYDNINKVLPVAA